MQCAATIPAALNGERAASQPRPATSPQSALSAPAASTSHGPKHDGSQSIIERRAARLRHSNLIQKARFVRLHQLLSRRSSEVTE